MPLHRLLTPEERSGYFENSGNKCRGRWSDDWGWNNKRGSHTPPPDHIIATSTRPMRDKPNLARMTSLELKPDLSKRQTRLINIFTFSPPNRGIVNHPFVCNLKNLPSNIVGYRSSHVVSTFRSAAATRHLEPTLRFILRELLLKCNGNIIHSSPRLRVQFLAKSLDPGPTLRIVSASRTPASINRLPLRRRSTSASV